MSEKSNNNGRAYEFSFLITLFEEISKERTVRIAENNSYFVAKKVWNTLNDDEKTLYKVSALTGIKTIFDLEPLIFEDGNDELELKIQSDDKGKRGGC